MKSIISPIICIFALSLTAPALGQESPELAATTETPAEKASTMDRVGTAASSAVRQTGAGLADAAMSPLEDLNLRRDEIPALLAHLESPYAMPHPVGCYELGLMIADLDAVLGPDWDAPKAEKREWDEKAADGAARAALNTVSSEASGMIPLRGVVRSISRADKHAKAYNKAFKIGGQRRAFLKGLGQAYGCTGNAAPRAADPSDSKIKYRTPPRERAPAVTRRVVKKPSTPNGN